MAASLASGTSSSRTRRSTRATACSSTQRTITTRYRLTSPQANPEHLDYVKFIGRILGLAAFHHRFLNAYFVSGFYKMVLNKVDPKRQTMSCTRALPG